MILRALGLGATETTETTASDCAAGLKKCLEPLIMSNIGASDKPPFVIPDGFAWDLSLFSIPEHYENDLKSVMIPHGLVMDRISKLAVDIMRAYRMREEGTRVHMLCVLKGGHQFFSDLCNALKSLTLTGCPQPPLTFEFIRAKSYDGTESKGAEGTKIECIGVDLKALAGRHILLCEDIVDTGNTMSMLVPYLQSFGCASVRVATLLQKRTDKSNGFKPDYTGFSIPDEFVVGYCLDYNEVYRDMSHICIMNPSGIAKWAK